MQSLKDHQSGNMDAINTQHIQSKHIQSENMQSKQVLSKHIQSSNCPSVSTPNIKKNNAVIVFDYDDTLFPTHKLREFLARPTNTTNTSTTPITKPITTESKTNVGNKYQSLLSKITDEEMNGLVYLSWLTLNLLTAYILQYSTKNIFIVSASGNGWIQHSLKLVYQIGYFSQIYDLLFNDRIGIENRILIIHPSSDVLLKFKTEIKCKNISQHPVLEWKYNVFEQIFIKRFVNSEHVINTFAFIGDSEYEYHAAKKLKRKIENIYPKNVFIDRIKLMIKPSINDIENEQKLLYKLCGIYERNSYLNNTGFDMDYLKEKKMAKMKESIN